MSLKVISANTTYWNMKTYENEVSELVKKNKALESKLDIVDWYIKVFEGGNDTREIVQRYEQLKVEHEKVRTSAKM